LFQSLLGPTCRARPSTYTVSLPHPVSTTGHGHSPRCLFITQNDWLRAVTVAAAGRYALLSSPVTPATDLL
jgi:hypothetical protein